MATELIESIRKMTVNGNRLELPKDEQFANYAQVKKCLLTAGGKYNKCGFIFQEDAKIIKDRLVGGEAINDKKKFQAFFSPELVVDMILGRADIRETDRWLEPSAGQAALADRAFYISQDYVMVELMPENCQALRRMHYDVMNEDFLKVTAGQLGSFDKIIANPPFTKNQDIDHIRHMYSFLNDNGRLVSVASRSWLTGSQKKQLAFKEWLEEVGGTVEEVSAGAFKESGTNISTVIVTINK